MSLPGLVASFLRHLDDEKHLAPFTMKAYRAAIGKMTNLATGFNPEGTKYVFFLFISI